MSQERFLPTIERPNDQGGRFRKYPEINLGSSHRVRGFELNVGNASIIVLSRQLQQPQLWVGIGLGEDYFDELFKSEPQSVRCENGVDIYADPELMLPQYLRMERLNGLHWDVYHKAGFDDKFRIKVGPATQSTRGTGYVDIRVLHGKNPDTFLLGIQYQEEVKTSNTKQITGFSRLKSTVEIGR